MNDYVKTLMYCLLFASFQAQASEPKTSEPKTEEQQPASSNYLIEAAYASAIDEEHNFHMTSLSAGKEFYRYKDVQLFGLMVFSSIDGEAFDDFYPELDAVKVSTTGTGVSGLVRWVPFRTSQNQLFIDGGLGAVYFDDEFPPNGSHWNFLIRFGGGLAYRVGDSSSLGVGYRWVHISNGTGNGEQNPASDNNSIFITYSTEFF